MCCGGYWSICTSGDTPASFPHIGHYLRGNFHLLLKGIHKLLPKRKTEKATMSIQQMDERYTITVQQIKELITRGKADDAKILFSLIGKVLKMVESRSVSEAVQLGNAQLQVFDDLIAGKSQIPLGKALQLVLIELYKTLLLPSVESGAAGAPGYVVRNIVTAAVSTMTNSKAPATAREVSATVVGEILAVQALMCGSMLSEVIAASMKMVRGSDTMQRVIALRTCAQIVRGGRGSIKDAHADIVKQAVKAVADKHPDVRMGVAELLAAVASNSCPARWDAESVSGPHGDPTYLFALEFENGPPCPGTTVEMDQIRASLLSSLFRYVTAGLPSC